MADNNYINGNKESVTRQRIQRNPGEYSQSRTGEYSRQVRSRAAQPAGSRSVHREAEASGRSSDQVRRPSASVSRQSAVRSSAASGTQRRPSQTGRPAGSSGHSNVRRRRKKSLFKKGLLIYSAFLVLILIIGVILFSSYLGAYEKSRPYIAAASLVKSFSSADGIEKVLTDNADKTDVAGDISSVIQSYTSNVAGKQISYVQNSDFRADAPSYNITADGSVVAQVTFEHQGSVGWGFPGWGISKLHIGQYIPEMTQYTVMVPQGSTVYLDGTPLDSSYITESGTPKVLRNVTEFLTEVPVYDTYTIPSMNVPNITAKDANGNDISLSQSDTTFSATTTDQTFIDSVKENTEATLDCYAKYFIYESHNLSAYMLPGTQLYTAIFGDDETYGIDPSLYNYEYITDYGYTEKEITNYVKYTDNCYTVDVKYHMYVNFSDDRFSDDNQSLDATWVFINDGTDWYLADSQSH